MRKPIFYIVTIMALMLSACAGGGNTASSPTAPTSRITPVSEEAPASNGCTVQSPRPTPGPTEISLFPPVTGEEWIRGPADAPVTILVYSDFECSSCARLASLLDQLLVEFPQEVRVVFRHLPLTGTPDKPYHQKAALAAQAAEAAGKAGKFWEMHDLLFARQAEWLQLTPEAFQGWLYERAADLSLDQTKFTADLTSQENQEKIQAAWERAVSIGMLTTPFVLINGQIWQQDMPMTLNTLSEVVRLNLLESQQFTTCPEMEIDRSKQYIATLQTEKGDIVIELFPEKAPLAVNNFVFLARQGWYDGVTFHRVLPGYVAQAGDPSGTGYGGPGYAFANENSDLKFDKAGLVAMANAGPDTNGSQFFITFVPTPKLNGGYTIFGQVIQGMDVAESLTPRNPAESPDLPPGDKIIRITIEEK